MAVLEIQANGDTAVSKEAIDHAGQLLEDPLMRVKDFKRMFITYISYEFYGLKLMHLSLTLTGIYPVVCTHRSQNETYSS